MVVKPRLLVVFGTRPEAIKMAPVVQAIRSDISLDSRICVTGQHREMLDEVLRLFEIRPDFDLNIMRRCKSLTDITNRILEGMQTVIEEFRPDRMLVHGDTTTAMAAALAAYYARVPIGHVEAGLRTGDLYAPWPEEGNRRIIGTLADLHFAPTKGAQDRLLKENVAPRSICVTGNTAIDALFAMQGMLAGDARLRAAAEAELPEATRRALHGDRRVLLVTGHRRENFGQGFADICAALEMLARRQDVLIVYPVHLNPNVREPVFQLLGPKSNIHLIEPLSYAAFVHLMQRAYLVLTDSGGIQEEAPSLGKPVLVMRDVTERPEAVDAGTVCLVGTDPARIVTEAGRLLDDEKHYSRMSRAHNPYGDGTAARRIVAHLRQRHGLTA